MTSRTGNRLALVVATAALAVGVAQAPATAGQNTALGSVRGVSDTGCSTADGHYSYGPMDGTPGYSAGWNLSVEDTCGGLVGHVRIKYSEWIGTGWEQKPWKTIASSSSGGPSVTTGYLINVRDVRFAVCDYTAAGNHDCGYLS